MTLKQLTVAYFTYPTILLYGVLCVAALGGSIALGALQHPLKTLAAMLFGIVLFPFYEYAVHRFILHSPLLYKNPLTAGLWKRIHYDHHQDPNQLDVLFGSPSNTLVAISVPGLVLGLVSRDWSAALALLAMSLILFAFYEFCHCVQHLNFIPKNPWLRAIKKQHMAHHFHSEQGNFGITSDIVDRLVGSRYGSMEEQPRSPSVNNLGYDDREAERYPWVALRSARQRART